MKIVFLSNVYNRHQSALAQALDRLTEGQFLFIESVDLPGEGKDFGLGQTRKPAYVKQAYSDQRAYRECIKRIDEADVVICGSAPEKMIGNRIRSKKLVFRYSERPLKHGFQPIKYLPRLMKWHLQNPPFASVYMLCASGYTASDYRKFGLFADRAFKWGYFPCTKLYSDAERLLSEKKTDRLLWCGRFTDFKHPDDAIRMARRLKEEGFFFTLDLIGGGEMEEEMRAMIDAFGLSENVHLLPPMSPEKVREQMEDAGIYLFTGDRREGWGAVLNEAMNSACAVVASHACGSVPFLVKDGENGTVYESGNMDMLCEKVKRLLKKPNEQKRLGRAAYRTVSEEWNARTAAERLIGLAECILSGEKPTALYESGPCSRAEIIHDHWDLTNETDRSAL